MNGARLQMVLEDLLDSAAAVLVPAPARQFIAHGRWAHDCVAEGTMISTVRGPVPIEELTTADEVWALLDGAMVRRPVTAVIDKGIRETVVLRTRRRQIEVTPEHEVLVLRRVGYRSWERQWVAAGSVERGDWLITANETPDLDGRRWLSDGTELTAEVAWLLGVIVGDGTVIDAGAAICVYGELRDKVAGVVRRVWDAGSSRSPSAGLYVYSSQLRDVLTDLRLNRRSTERQVPSLVTASGHKIIRAFLDGYAAADGHQHARGGTAYAAANRRLVTEIRGLHQQLGDGVTNLHEEKRARPIVIKGKVVPNPRPLWRFAAHAVDERSDGRFGDTRLLRSVQRVLPDPLFGVDRVGSVTPGRSVAVWDITVPDAHCFLADGAVVHNCEALAVQVDDWRLEPFDQNQPCAVVNVITIALTVLRCVETATENAPIPGSSGIQADSLTLAHDLGDLVQGLSDRLDAGTLFSAEANVGCDQVSWTASTPIGPEAGIAGWQVTLVLRD